MDPSDTATIPELVPVRMLNEHVYCPRLAYLEWVQGEFADSADTVEGRFRHRRIDRRKGRVASPEEVEENASIHARSVQLSDLQLGLVAKIDLIEGEDGEVWPVDTKRGRPPDIPERAWPPERVQVCAQALLLRAHGYRCSRGYLYFAESRERVEIVIDQALVETTLTSLRKMRETAKGGRIPPPLQDSPKCPRCSLVGICLPDEVGLLR